MWKHFLSTAVVFPPTGVKRVRDLCKVLRLPSLFEDTAVSYYQQAIKRPCFSLVSLEKKEMLVGCCVFVTCRQHNWPLTMGTVCLLLYGDKELFAKTYLRFLKELALDVPTLTQLDGYGENPPQQVCRSSCALSWTILGVHSFHHIVRVQFPSFRDRIYKYHTDCVVY